MIYGWWDIHDANMIMIDKHPNLYNILGYKPTWVEADSSPSSAMDMAYTDRDGGMSHDLFGCVYGLPARGGSPLSL